MLFLTLGQVGFRELIIILAVLLLVFGASRIPKIARSLGKSTGEFKKGLREGADKDSDDEDDDKPSESA